MNPTWLYVGLVYAAAIEIARRAGVDFPRRVAALFYLLVCIWLFRPMTTMTVNIATDNQLLVAPWSASAPPGFDKYSVSNHEGQDVVYQIAPWAAQVREAWLSGRVPLWNSRVGCGLPLLANMSSEALSPLRLLVTPLPLGFLMTAEGALKILAALSFMFLFCRRRFDLVPSILGAIAFSFGGWMNVWLNFPPATVGAFLPAVFLQIDLLAERATFGRIAFAAALGPIVLFGGHPETTAHMAFYAALLIAWWLAVERGIDRRRFAKAIAIAAAIGLLLSMPLLAPFLESVRKSIRYVDVARGVNVRGTPYSDFPSLIPMVQPRFFGTRPGPAWGPATAESIAGFAGFAGVAAWFALLVRCVIRREFRSREAFFVVATVLIVGLIDDWPLLSPPFRALFALANNHRLRLMFAFLVASMLAALLQHAPREKTTLFAAQAFGIALLAVIFTRIAFPSSDAREHAILTAIPGVVVLALVALMRWHRHAGAIVGAALFLELWLSGHHWNPVFPLDTLFPRTPLIDAMSRLHRGTPFRIAGIGGPLFPNTQAVFGFEDARTHDPMAYARYETLLQQSMRQYDPLEYYAKFKEPDAPILDYLNVRWLLTERSTDLADRERYALVYDGRGGRIWENRHVLPRFFAARNVILDSDFRRLAGHTDWKSTAFVTKLPKDTSLANDLLAPRPAGAPVARVTITSHGDDRYELQTDAPRQTLVVSSIVYWPGWRVTWGGRRLQPMLVNGAFLGFIVPAGHGVVRVRYVPLSFWGGVAVALAALVLLVALRRGIARAVSPRPGNDAPDGEDGRSLGPATA